MNQAFQQILKNQMTIMEELGDIKFCVLGLLKGHIPDDYYMDEDGELVCRCPECPMNPNYDHWEE